MTLLDKIIEWVGDNIYYGSDENRFPPEWSELIDYNELINYLKDLKKQENDKK